MANYSVVLGSWECMECSHSSSYNFIWLTVVKHHRYQTGLGLLFCCCLFTVFGTSYSTRINLMSISVAVAVLLVIIRASSGKVYRNKVVGFLELFYLSNLGIWPLSYKLKYSVLLQFLSHCVCLHSSSPPSRGGKTKQFV